MKKNYFFLILFTSVFLWEHSYAQISAIASGEGKVKWLTFEQAVELQKKEPRKIMVDVYTNWCGWCKVMDSKTFNHDSIAKYMGKKYYAVKLNAETRDTIRYKGKNFVYTPENRSNELALNLLSGQMSYPSIVFLNEKMEMLTVLKGFQQPPQFDAVLKYFGGNDYLKIPWEDFQKNYKSNIN